MPNQKPDSQLTAKELYEKYKDSPEKLLEVMCEHPKLDEFFYDLADHPVVVQLRQQDEKMEKPKNKKAI